MKRVVVGLSGGVDSSVAAYLLKQRGYEVIAIFMKNWHDDSVTISNECPWLDDSNDAVIVADALDIPFQIIDLSDSYKKRIVDYMFNEYKQGRTPNPDVLCNREIKFDIFLKIAMDLGADYVATGHYCIKKIIKKKKHTYYRLLAGKDNNKDQSYFLCQLSQNQIKKALFPLGSLTKQEVRKVAEEQNLITANKKDSQGLCFIGKVKLPEFLQQKLAPKAGDIIEIDKNNSIYNQVQAPLFFRSEEERLAFKSKKYNYRPYDGEIIGKHQGAHYFTKGQRKGLNIGGKVEPVFVIDTNVKTNTVYVGQSKNHPGLYRSALFITNDELHWVRPDLSLEVDESLNVLARIRYRQSLQSAILYRVKNGLYINFEKPQSAVTEGQFVVWYLKNELIGSGVIS